MTTTETNKAEGSEELSMELRDLHVRVVDVAASQGPDYDGTTAYFSSAEFSEALTASPLQGRQVTHTLAYKVKLKHGASIAATLQARALVTVRVTGDSSLEDADVRAWLQNFARMTLHPYLRAAISSAATIAGLPSVTVGVIWSGDSRPEWVGAGDSWHNVSKRRARPLTQE